MDSEFVLKEREDPKIETLRRKGKWGEQLGGAGGERWCARDFNWRIVSNCQSIAPAAPLGSEARD